MKLRNLLILAFLIALPIGIVALGQAEAPPSPESPTAWLEVGEGIEYQKYHLSSPVPVDIFVTRMDRNNPSTTIESAIGQGRLSGGAETTSNMAARYDGALNFWGPPTIPVSSTWGSTNQVVVAINGFYYGEPQEDPGVPWSGQVHSGWYAKRYSDYESSSGFIWKMDRTTFIGACISHPDDKQYAYTEAGEFLLISGVNRARDDEELILYTSQYDRDTDTSGSGTEVVVEMLAPSYISIFGNMPYGIVRQIRAGGNSTPIPFDHIVLSGQGSRGQELSNNLQVGEYVGIGQRVVDCPNETAHDWTKAYAGVGGHWRFLRNGVIFPYDDDPTAGWREPRTVIAYNSQYIFFIVADGRNPGTSEGMTVAEMGAFAKNTLGATDAIMQDGGGSSTMVINGEVVNNTYCNHFYCNPELPYKLFLPLATTQNNPQVGNAARPGIAWDDEAQTIQRLVGNGMLMVVVQPEDKSTMPYDPDDPVATIVETDVYLGPGTNYAVLNTANGDGTIMSPLNNMGGIYAKGTYWWKVDFGGGIKGWVPEENIIQLPKLRSKDDFKAR